MSDPSSLADRGVLFPRTGDTRPTTPVLREVLASAVRAVDERLAAEISATPQWRSDYLRLVRRATEVTASPEGSAAVARDGLASFRGRMVVAEHGEEIPLGEWTAKPADRRLATTTVHGTHAPVPRLQVPYRGALLSDDRLREQLATWVDDQVVEPGFAEAIGTVIDHPEWLAVPDRRLVLVGGAAEMSPLESLLSWGADVLVVDVAVPAVSSRLRAIAERTAGRLTAPAADDGTLGADLSRDLAAVRTWVGEEAGDAPVLGMYAYADRGAHVEVSAAFDALATAVTADDAGTTLAYLATPTDAYVVGPSVVAAARDAYGDRGPWRWLQAPVRAASRGRAYAPHYDGGADVADVLVAQQGPSYAMAKRVQRWRGVEEVLAGRRVSFNVAPATRTRSVRKNRVLHAAYTGAHHFGIEVFDPATSRALMAAKLVHDLYADVPRYANPEQLFADDAAHGGLWRVGYEPRSALPFAVVAGLPAMVRRS